MAAPSNGMRRRAAILVCGVILGLVCVRPGIAAEPAGVGPGVGGTATGDPAAGKAVFARCQICHTLDAGGRNGAGPNLHGLFGRKAGSAAQFAYSAAMKNAGVVWNETTLRAYLRDPKRFMPGTRMAFPGIADERDIADLLAYLREATR
jgi:cytochrome c